MINQIDQTVFQTINDVQQIDHHFNIIHITQMQCHAIRINKILVPMAIRTIPISKAISPIVDLNNLTDILGILLINITNHEVHQEIISMTIHIKNNNKEDRMHRIINNVGPEEKDSEVSLICFQSIFDISSTLQETDQIHLVLVLIPILIRSFSDISHVDYIT